MPFNDSTRKQPSFPSIDPVQDNGNRPLWSVMIPTYNPQEDFLEQAIKSVLLQGINFKKMQIEVIDDGSINCDVEALVAAWGKGRIAYFRQPHNVGMVINFNTCIERARGHWVHIFHDDDLLLPGFYGHLEAATRKPALAGAAFCRHNFINQNQHETFRAALEQKTRGLLQGWSGRIAKACRIQCCSIVVKRSSYELIGGFDPAARLSADWEMWVRIAAHFPVWYEPQLLASYRQHENSMTSGLMRSAKGIEDINNVINLYQAYLPADVYQRCAPKARKHYALYALNIARSMLKKGEFEAAQNFIREGLKCDNSPAVMQVVDDMTRHLPHLFKGDGAN